MTIASEVQASRLTRLQVGKESTWGTGVAATAILSGVTPTPTITPTFANTAFDEQVGSLTPSYASAQLATGATWSHGGNLSYEDVLYLLSMAYGVPTPSGSYVWTFAPAGAATFTPLSLTMELVGLDAAKAMKATGCLLDAWSIAGEQGKQLTYTAAGFAKTFSNEATPTGSLSTRTTERALMASCALSLDVAGGTPGTTPYAGRLVSFNLSGSTGLGTVMAAGSLGPRTFSYAKQDLGLKLGVLYDSTLATYLGTNPQAGLPMVVQVKATSGAKSIEIDYSGVVTANPSYWGDSQNAKIIELDLSPQYDATLAYYAKFVVNNTVATLP